jgi:hypothetical protein
MCQTAFTPPSCSGDVAIARDGTMSADTATVAVDGCHDADARLGVQCEVLLGDGTSLGVFRATMAESAGGSDGDGTARREVVMHHPLLQWPRLSAGGFRSLHTISN